MKFINRILDNDDVWKTLYWIGVIACVVAFWVAWAKGIPTVKYMFNLHE